MNLLQLSSADGIAVVAVRLSKHVRCAVCVLPHPGICTIGASFGTGFRVRIME